MSDFWLGMWTALLMFGVSGIVHTVYRGVRYRMNPDKSELKNLVWLLKMARLFANEEHARIEYARLLGRKPFAAELSAGMLVCELLSSDPIKISYAIERIEVEGVEALARIRDED